MIAALFDCDGTLTGAMFGRGLLKHCSENGRKGLARRYYAAVSIPYMINKLGMYPDEPLLRMVIDRLALLLADLDEAAVDALFDWNSHSYLLPTRRPEVITRLDEHRAQGHKIIFVSAQFLPNLEKMGAALGADLVIGTKIARRNGGWSVVPPILAGEHKRTQTLLVVEKQGWEIDWAASSAYGDSYTDMAMFEMVGRPVAVHPDARLDIYARRAGWERIK